MNILSLGLALPMFTAPVTFSVSYNLQAPEPLAAQPAPLVAAQVPTDPSPCLTWDRQQLDFVSGCRSLFNTYISQR